VAAKRRFTTAKRICLECKTVAIHPNDDLFETRVCFDCTAKGSPLASRLPIPRLQGPRRSTSPASRSATEPRAKGFDLPDPRGRWISGTTNGAEAKCRATPTQPISWQLGRLLDQAAIAAEWSPKVASFVFSVRQQAVESGRVSFKQKRALERIVKNAREPREKRI
jgi:hypothetical protein